MITTRTNELALLWEFAEAAFEEACTSRLDTILQPVIHLREERNHHHYHRTGLSPPVIVSDSSSLPSPIQQPRQRPKFSPITSQSSNNSGPSIPQVPLGSFHNPIVVEEDDSDNETRTPTDNTQCPRCHRYIHNSHHSKDYCDTIFVPGTAGTEWCFPQKNPFLDMFCDFQRVFPMEIQKVFLKEKSEKHIMCFFQVSHR